MSDKLNGGLNQAQINALKKEYNTKSLFLITVETEDEPLFFWMKKPDMTVLSAVASLADNDPIKAGQVMFHDCLVKGDPHYADDVDVFPAISEQLHKTMNTAKSTLEKF